MSGKRVTFIGDVMAVVVQGVVRPPEPGKALRLTRHALTIIAFGA